MPSTIAPAPPAPHPLLLLLFSPVCTVPSPLFFSAFLRTATAPPPLFFSTAVPYRATYLVVPRPHQPHHLLLLCTGPPHRRRLHLLTALPPSRRRPNSIAARPPSRNPTSTRSVSFPPIRTLKPHGPCHKPHGPCQFHQDENSSHTVRITPSHSPCQPQQNQICSTNGAASGTKTVRRPFAMPHLLLLLRVLLLLTLHPHLSALLLPQPYDSEESEHLSGYHTDRASEYEAQFFPIPTRRMFDRFQILRTRTIKNTPTVDFETLRAFGIEEQFLFLTGHVGFSPAFWALGMLPMRASPLSSFPLYSSSMMRRTSHTSSSACARPLATFRWPTFVCGSGSPPTGLQPLSLSGRI